MAGDVSSVLTREVVTAAPGDTAAAAFPCGGRCLGQRPQLIWINAAKPPPLPVSGTAEALRPTRETPP